MSVFSLCLDRMPCSWMSPLDAGDACQFCGGPIPTKGLVLGRGSALFRVVRLGGHKVRKARGNAADAHDAADVFLYRDSSIAPLLDMRRRFKAVMDVLDGASLSRSVERDSYCGTFVPCYFQAISMLLMVWVSVIFIVLFLMFIIVSVTSSRGSLFTVEMRLSVGGGIGLGRTPGAPV